MSPDWVISLVIFVCYVVHRIALRKYQAREGDHWLGVALGVMLIEVEARKARDRPRSRDVTGTGRA